MSKPFRRMTAAGCLTLLVASGCSLRVADLTLVSTKNIDLSDASLDIRRGQRHEGKDCVFLLFGVIPIPFRLPNLEEAVDAALERGQGNVMVDQVTYAESLYFILGGQSCLRVEGTVLRTAAAP